MMDGGDSANGLWMAGMRRGSTGESVSAGSACFTSVRRGNMIRRSGLWHVRTAQATAYYSSYVLRCSQALLWYVQFYLILPRMR